MAGARDQRYGPRAGVAPSTGGQAYRAPQPREDPLARLRYDPRKGARDDDLEPMGPKGYPVRPRAQDYEGRRELDMEDYLRYARPAQPEHSQAPQPTPSGHK